MSDRAAKVSALSPDTIAAAENILGCVAETPPSAESVSTPDSHGHEEGLNALTRTDDADVLSQGTMEAADIILRLLSPSQGPHQPAVHLLGRNKCYSGSAIASVSPQTLAAAEFMLNRGDQGPQDAFNVLRFHTIPEQFPSLVVNDIAVSDDDNWLKVTPPKYVMNPHTMAPFEFCVVWVRSCDLSFKVLVMDEVICQGNVCKDHGALIDYLDLISDPGVTFCTGFSTENTRAVINLANLVKESHPINCFRSQFCSRIIRSYPSTAGGGRICSACFSLKRNCARKRSTDAAASKFTNMTREE